MASEPSHSQTTSFHLVVNKKAVAQNDSEQDLHMNVPNAILPNPASIAENSSPQNETEPPLQINRQVAPKSKMEHPHMQATVKTATTEITQLTDHQKFTSPRYPPPMATQNFTETTSLSSYQQPPIGYQVMIISLISCVLFGLIILLGYCLYLAFRLRTNRQTDSTAKLNTTSSMSQGSTSSGKSISRLQITPLSNAGADDAFDFDTASITTSHPTLHCMVDVPVESNGVTTVQAAGSADASPSMSQKMKKSPTKRWSGPGSSESKSEVGAAAKVRVSRKL
ncbi:hypothetical protein BJ741DRAFT_623775 [Chytriomyces cf. hyalinus JEL632]|nr:hypothetical protein BJ741DRAFT_623775 [Chytriomyces cf. hyalinus JEL632]